MVHSYECSKSLSEHSPLLRDTWTPMLYERVTTPGLHRGSIFTWAVVCILFTELCERLTFYGIIGNFVLFATESDHLNFSPSLASILVYAFQGTCYFLPIFGGWLADSKFGKFSVIFLSAIIYLIGTIFLLLGSITYDKGEKSQWAATGLTTNTHFIQGVYITGLVLVSFGTGGIKANVSPFGAEQVSNLGPHAIQAFFRRFYLFINIGALLAVTVVVYVQQNVSYFYGNLTLACSLILALIIFLAGKPKYSLHAPTSSVLATTLSIVKEAIKRSRRSSLSTSFVDHWLDRAKMCFGGSYSSWEVEEVKKVYRLLPIFATFVLYWTVYAQMDTSMLYQGKYTDINLGNSFKIPVASLSLFDTVGVVIFIPIVEKLINPCLARFGIRPSQLQHIGFGMLIATASMACAGGMEIFRIRNCCIFQPRGDKNDTQVANITIFYQVPQYTLIGLSEVFTCITGLELAYTEAPKSLQGVVMGVYHLTIALGTYLGAVLLAIVNAISGASGEKYKWYPDEDYIDKGYQLAYYFFLLAGIMFLNFIVYVFVAVNFKKRKESAFRANCSSNGILNDGGENSELLGMETSRDSWTSSNHHPTSSC